jgi:hypothetical protein
MSLTSAEVLRDVAREAHTTTWDQDYIVPTVGYFSLHCRFKRQGWTVECGAGTALRMNKVYYHTDDLLSLRVRCVTSITVAIGGIDPVHVSRTPIASIGELQVSVNEGRIVESENWLNRAETKALLAGISLSHGERLFIWQNAAELFVMPAGTSVIWKRLDALFALLSTLPSQVQTRSRITKTDVPVALHPALPLLSRWALSDDHDRELRIGKARTRSLVVLRDTVVPLLGDIDAYLVGFGATTPESANRLGDLAQAAIEARQELNRRAVSL